MDVPRAVQRAIFWLSLIGVFIFIFRGLDYRFGGTHSSQAYRKESSEQEHYIGKEDPKWYQRLSHPAHYDEHSVQSQFCEDRFGVSYLHRFVENAINYCTPESASQITCFSNSIDTGGRVDSFCVITNVVHDRTLTSRPFQIECQPRGLTQDERGRGIPELNALPVYWYSTGPAYMFRFMFSFLSQDKREFLQNFKDQHPNQIHPWVTLTKREDAWDNVWHTLMEVMSAWFSLDILKLASETNPEIPTFDLTKLGVQNHQMILVDDHPNGLVFDSWMTMTNNKVHHLSDMPKTPPIHLYSHVILPLPGGSNPFWQGDWVPLNCANSTLLRGFADRMLTERHLNDESFPAEYSRLLQQLEDPPNLKSATTTTTTTTTNHPTLPLKIVLITRQRKRRLVNQSSLLRSFSARYPDIRIHPLDLATWPFPAQLLAAHTRIDVLIGVHGAGLTHGMFMRPGSALVEFMPFSLDHKGFRNMARMVGLDYYRGQTADRPDVTGAKGDWQEDPVWIEQDVFDDVVLSAVRDHHLENGK